MKCAKCGWDNPVGSKYCSRCGQPIAQQIPVSQMPPGRTPAATQAEKYAAKEKTKKRRIALICGVWSIALIAFAAMLLSRNITGKDAEEPSSALAASTEASEAATTTQPTPAEWSLWADELPAGVSDGQYEIETQTLYRARTQETTSASQDTLAGWELCGAAKGDGSFGAWSEWSIDAVTPTDEREVETQTRYRYRNKETTTGASSGMSGWTQYDVSYAWSDYGAWSGWSTDYVSSSDSRKVESKTQYRCRDISYTTEYTDWGSWNDWQWAKESSGDLKQEESRNVWGYAYFQCAYCGAHMHGYGSCWTWAGGCGRATSPYDGTGVWHEIWSTVSWNDAGLKDWHGTGKYYTYINGELVFKWSESGSPKTQYRYRTRSTYQETNYGSWSGWGDAYYSSSSTREVESRTVYRYCDRSQLATYYFYRWTNWSDWSSTAASPNNDRQVETTTFYRYRDKEYEPVYYFTRWTDWSEWSPDVIAASDAVEVETKTQYRYRQK